jgi:hypothetical protein
MMRLALIAPLLLTLGAGCSAANDIPDPAADVFAGLDPTAVSDVLGSRAAHDNVAILQADDRNSMWQGMVGNFSLCRDMLATYSIWLSTGTPPDDLPSPRVPMRPEPSFPDVETSYEFYRGLIRSGDASQLRAALTNPSGCGAWVPAEPGSPDGPTVADAVRSAG